MKVSFSPVKQPVRRALKKTSAAGICHSTVNFAKKNAGKCFLGLGAIALGVINSLPAKETRTLKSQMKDLVSEDRFIHLQDSINGLKQSARDEAWAKIFVKTQRELAAKTKCLHK